ncbi:hypothetical protein ACIPLR_21185 [Herbaspirillum huttiense]|uniref:hypothetical protein n=1 Tax=Herbaspirillum huttiense TaxID=863372 RepID=UPI00381C5B02
MSTMRVVTFAPEHAYGKSRYRERAFDDGQVFLPIAFRTQNGGDYPDSHVLAEHIAPGQSGLTAHVAEAGPG